MNVSVGAQPTARALRARERRDQLLTSALALFAERGFENASMKDLAAAAGVAPGLVYHYFRSRQTRRAFRARERGNRSSSAGADHRV